MPLAKPKKASRRRKAKTRAPQLRGIVQGVAKAPRKALGSRRKVSTGFTAVRAMDATTPLHLGLPIATGAYTVGRFTQIISTADPLILFGVFRSRWVSEVAGVEQWDRSGWAPYVAASPTSAAFATGNSPYGHCQFWRSSQLSSLGDATTIVPSALTVQLMNPNPLQTTSGIVYMGRLSTQFRGSDNVEQWKDLANLFVGTQSPRLLSAAKIAMRGVKVDAVPFNLSELMDFDRIQDIDDTATSPYSMGWNTEAAGGDNRILSLKGFSPIVVYNPQLINLQYLVTVEARVRFNMANPASSSHRSHPSASHKTWNDTVQHMTAQGHGVLDIVESVASNMANLQGLYNRGSAAMAAFM